MRSNAAMAALAWSHQSSLLRSADIYGWTAGISASVAGRRWEHALVLQAGLLPCRLEPNLITTNALIGGDAVSGARSPWAVSLLSLRDCDVARQQMRRR